MEGANMLGPGQALPNGMVLGPHGPMVPVDQNGHPLHPMHHGMGAAHPGQMMTGGPQHHIRGPPPPHLRHPGPPPNGPHGHPGLMVGVPQQDPAAAAAQGLAGMPPGPMHGMPPMQNPGTPQQQPPHQQPPPHPNAMPPNAKIVSTADVSLCYTYRYNLYIQI